MANKGHFIKSNRYVYTKPNHIGKAEIDNSRHYSWLMDQLRWQWGFIVPLKPLGYCSTNLDMTIAIMVKS